MTPEGVIRADHWSEIDPADWRWPHFSPKEMACRGTGRVLVSCYAMDRLEALRKALGNKPFIINSAYRSPEHNRAGGGAKASKHMEGLAFDVSMSNHEPHRFLEEAKLGGFRGIGTYPRQNFIHIDTRDTPATWGSPFPPGQEEFSPEPNAHPAREAAKGSGGALIAATAAHQAGTTALDQWGSVLPAEWVMYGAAAVALLGVALAVWRAYGRGRPE